MIKVSNLSKKLSNKLILDDINLNLKKGSIYGLIGANGSGKTTLIKHLVGIYKADMGSVKIDGLEVFENKYVKHDIGYIQDGLYFFPMYSIKKMADFYRKMFRTFDEDRYKNMLESFELKEDLRISRLSKGMKRQVAFILTLSTLPKVLILDEPIDGLDPLMRKKVLNFIMEDVSERQMSVLISSHNLKELESICDHVGILNKGKMLMERDLDELKSDIHKIQVAYSYDIDDVISKEIDVLHSEKRGSVSLFIVKGNKENIFETLEKYNPLILDVLPLTLEEIFIYELGGVGHEIKDVIF
ncbi:MAG: ABC transporter ATP-binding protein [Peptostreptococcaceae bacterium]|nr:ABC transporter ATP-binding protein [Peptostreptococcaceae bacterium]